MEDGWYCCAILIHIAHVASIGWKCRADSSYYVAWGADMPKAIRFDDEEEEEFPPPPPPNKPLAPGTLVTGFNPQGLFGFPGHNNHLFVIIDNERKRQFTNSGFRTVYRCIACQDCVSQDGEFGAIAAGKSEVAKFRNWLGEEVDRLVKAEKEVRKRWQQATR